MKKFFLTLITITTAALSLYAQPRAAGGRIGVTGFEASYQHGINKNQFAEGDIGIDFGYRINSIPGFKATAIYNFIWARPAWTNQGSWALYAGPGASLGYVNDMVAWKASNGDILASGVRNGFMLGICGQVGLEYTFWFPLQLAVDLRPVIGLHINEGYSAINPIDQSKTTRYGSRVGFYDNGLMGLVPTISARYRF